ncbi:hypothetical protein [Actinotalea sp. K2]|uniref:glycosyl hydrolase 2 galactose-binding domain-containing protein n=1 Tax=Actinotalea sp. K2 TaxID=2939438 RepID=UPI002017D476|nr:hypothetical protein [Actinotalea sp. K2]MCL3862333.1 hypothetical protein [Actinotalea sp. K2]
MTTTAPRPSDVVVGPQLTTVADWTLRVRGPLDTVPESLRPRLARGLAVTTPVTALGALVAAGLVPDVTVDAREAEVQWVAATAWELRTTVARPTTGAAARLVLHGVDTVGRVVVDGVVRAEVENMFVRHEVELDLVAPVAADHNGEPAWDVRVELDPVLPVATAAEAENPLPRPLMYVLPYNQVRKMACSFGWDWGPVTMAAGLWRPVDLEVWDGPRWQDVLLSTGWTGTHGTLTLSATATDGASTAQVRVRAAGETAAGRVVGTLPVVDSAVAGEVPVPDVLPWHPVGSGDQPLYDVTVELLGETGEVLDRQERRTGFRTVTLRQDSDAQGRSFEIHVNGRRIWARGYNWIPPHVLPEVVTKDWIRHLVGEAVDSGANILRVWGGGVVESPDFYDVCDELGVMVWQDFQFACAPYPEDEVTRAHVADEVREAVRSVGHRVSLVLWCGCNENLWGYVDWGWQEILADRPWGDVYYYDVIPGILGELDPARPYIPGSPFSPDPTLHPNDPTQGTTHHWDTWNALDYTAFDGKTTRFAAEFGWQGPASWPVLVRGLGGEPTGLHDPKLLRLQKAERGTESLVRGIEAHVPDVTDGRSWFLAAQLVQARAVRASIGRFRSLHDACSGAIWWQLDDDWPALSWSVLDVAGRRKLSWYAMREVLSPRAVLPTAPDEAAALTLVNDTDEAWETIVLVTAVSLTTGALGRREGAVVVPAQGHAVVRYDDALPEGTDAVVVDAGGLRSARWLRPDLDLGAPSATATLRVRSRTASTGTVSGEPGTVELEVRAGTVVRDLVLLAETDPRLADVVVDAQLITLLPDETVTFTVRGQQVTEIPDADWAGLLALAGPLEVSVQQL